LNQFRGIIEIPSQSEESARAAIAHSMVRELYRHESKSSVTVFLGHNTGVMPNRSGDF
jgi:hypothetical protein